MGSQPETHVISLYLGLGGAGNRIGVTSEVRLRIQVLFFEVVRMLSICLLIIEIPFKVNQSGSVQAKKIFKVDRLAPENIKVTRSGSRKSK